MRERLEREIPGRLRDFTVKIRRKNSIDNMNLSMNHNVDFMEKGEAGEEMGGEKTSSGGNQLAV